MVPTSRNLGVHQGAPNRSSRCWPFADRTGWQLTGHFFRAMFDFGILTQAGADSFKHMLLGVAGGVVAVGLLLTRIFIERYGALASSATPEPYRHALLGDDMLIIGLPMLLLAFMTLLASESLFPDERDFRILGPLPVRKAVIFGAKMAALLFFSGLFIVVAHVALVPMMLLTSMNPWREHTPLLRLTAWAVTSVSASAFAVFAITGIVGVLVLMAPRGRLHVLIALLRSTVLAALVLSVPLLLSAPSLGTSLSSGLGWMALVPPAWFVGLHRVLVGNVDPWFAYLATIALAALGVAATTVAVAYTVLFRHFERLVLRSATTSPVWPQADATTALSGATPPFRAVYRFTTTTLWRSPLHQSVLIGLSACGVGIAINRFSGEDLANWSGAGQPYSSSLLSAVMWMPFVLMFACGLGVRAALALPLEQNANWIFRLTEDDAARRDQLRAVDHVVTAYVVGVPLAATMPGLWLALGSGAVIAAFVVALLGLVFVHGVLLDWHRIPFTCSYLPGKRFVAQSLVVVVVAFVLFTFGGRAMVRTATAGTRQALLITGVLFLIAYLLRRRRLAAWRETPLMFEDDFPDQPQPLRLETPITPPEASCGAPQLFNSPEPAGDVVPTGEPLSRPTSNPRAG